MTYGPEEFAADTGVSRETLDRLRLYVDTLMKWQKRINLIGPSTVAEVWRRHVLDSAQVLPEIDPNVRVVTDLGSGGGFPGVVLALCLPDHCGPEVRVHMIESNQKKASFLNHVLRETGASAKVHCDRIEALVPWPSDVVTARACASIDKLLAYSEAFRTHKSVCLFLKGRDAVKELTEASECWTYRRRTIKSRSDPSGHIVVLTNVARRSGGSSEAPLDEGLKS